MNIKEDITDNLVMSYKECIHECLKQLISNKNDDIKKYNIRLVMKSCIKKLSN